jgi:hypothetical protein
MIKKILLIGLAFLQTEMAFAQLDFSSNITQTKAIQDMSMLIQVDTRKVEVLPKLRGLTQKNGSYQIIESGALFSKDIYGVAYDHTQKAQIILSGEISFKILSAYNISALPSSLSLISKIIVNPNIYAINTSSPSELVNVYNQLKSNKTIEWVELKSNLDAIK